MHGDHKKQKTSLRYWLHGRGYYRALKAMDLAESLHTGFRKDGITPEFAHQIWIANYIRTLTPGLQHPEEAIAVGLLHDSVEDYHVSRLHLEESFGPVIAKSTWTISKVRDGFRISDELYYAELAKDVIAAISKGTDRTHNLGSMVGILPLAKRRTQCRETREFVLPMLKKARRAFPEHELPIENVKQMLLTRLHLIEQMDSNQE